MTARSCLMILADGARPGAVEELLAAGELPNIERHLVARGSYARATSSFPTTSGPAHLPFLTGCFAGTADVPGYRWLDRRTMKPGLPLGPWCLRSYNGLAAFRFDGDISAPTQTLFELTPEATNVFGWIKRGLPGRRNLVSARKGVLWSLARYASDFDRADRVAARALLADLDEPRAFRFVVLPGIDWRSHYVGPDDPRTLELYCALDALVGDAAERLARAGTYEQTMIVVVSDHGHHRVHTHFDLALWLERERGIRTAYQPWRALRRDPEAVACVSGNGMAHVYFRGASWAREQGRDEIERAHPGLVGELTGQPAVDVIVTRGRTGLLVESRRGRARIERVDESFTYEPLDRDPFGWGPLPVELSAREALELTAESDYPDAIVQIEQLFRSARCGDLVVSATPGFDLHAHERPEHRSSHGSLHASHMLVPVASSVPLADGPLRTADLFATVLDYLGGEAPPGTDGVSRLGAASRATAASTA